MQESPIFLQRKVRTKKIAFFLKIVLTQHFLFGFES